MKEIREMMGIDNDFYEMGFIQKLSKFHLIMYADFIIDLLTNENDYL